MTIYHFMLNSKPFPANPESETCGGAYICCWVSSDSHDDAMDKAKEHCREEGWEALAVEEDFIAQREQYVDPSESLECYDEAVEYGMSSIFHTWPIDAPDADIEPN